MNAHTPGPWEWGNPDNGKGYSSRFLSHEGGTVLYHYAGWQVRDKDAALIAAAPDLLTSLKELIDGVDEYWMTENPGAVDRAAAAIAKAEGKTA